MKETRRTARTFDETLALLVDLARKEDCDEVTISVKADGRVEIRGYPNRVGRGFAHRADLDDTSADDQPNQVMHRAFSHWRG